MLIHLNVLGILNKIIIFLCTGNSCRSQIAEGLAKKYLSNYTVKSAGTHPEPINPLAIEIMNEIDIDISNYKSKFFTDRELEDYDLIITLCGDAKDQCVNLNSFADKHIHWDIQDPAKVLGSKENKLLFFRNIRNQLGTKIKSLDNVFN